MVFPDTAWRARFFDRVQQGYYNFAVDNQNSARPGYIGIGKIHYNPGHVLQQRIRHLQPAHERHHSWQEN
jgi:hypothetical protein